MNGDSGVCLVSSPALNSASAVDSLSQILDGTFLVFYDFSTLGLYELVLRTPSFCAQAHSWSDLLDQV